MLEQTLLRIEKAVQLAAFLQAAANREETYAERVFLSDMASMVQDPLGKAFAIDVADQVFRPRSWSRASDQLQYLIAKRGIPSHFPRFVKLGLALFKYVKAPFLIPIVTRYIRYKTQKIIIPQEALAAHIKIRQKEGVRLNLNHLGEAILGEKEARRRLDVYLSDLKDSSVDYISVKVSTLYSQIQLLDWSNTLQILAGRYKHLLLAAGSSFVNLDMEEYRDFHLTIALFKKVLSDPDCKNISAGIVLQSYLPDSYQQLVELIEFAKARGGAPIKIRLVKGANLAMEKIETSLKGWHLAPYATKRETDANFIKMIDYALHKENTAAVKIGVGSHNLFDIAYTWQLAGEREVLDALTIEMLEGMAEPIRRAVQQMTARMLLYCPIASKEEFSTAFAYLIRRLDENTAEDNFLRVAFDLQPGSAAWKIQENAFRNSVVDTVETTPHRYQAFTPRQNEPDTDFSLPHNIKWGLSLIEEWKGKEIQPIPLVKDIDVILASAKLAPKGILDPIAQKLREGRGRLIGAMLKEVSKTVYEADAEVSEAVDFATYYNTLSCEGGKPKGIVLVASPWNFPCSIPAGGILAALAAGNAVIFKPAPEAVLVGYELVKLFYEAGVPKDVLQFCPCSDEMASLLVKDNRVACVLLTGSTATAEHLLKIRPGLDLIAETGGKNSIIVTALADRDLAVRDIVQSAFSYAGQKCSACSVLILEEEVFNDLSFKKQLMDATESLHVGSAYDPATKVNPLIRPPQGALKQVLQSDDPLVKPKILWDVKPGSFEHQNELFGPVLCVMRAKNLKEAVTIANSTPYGLTAGIHSLDEREHEYWKTHIIAGNCYINRGITGAIVQRQPFGGTKKSSFGPGLKAGGPNALIPLMHVEQSASFEESAKSYRYFWEHYFSKEHELAHLLGQSNILKYVPYEKMILRVLPQDQRLDVELVHFATHLCKTPLKISRWDEESDEDFLKQAKECRVRLLSWPSPLVVKALSDLSIWQMPKPVVSNGRIELLNYLREVSISYDYHRYGNIT